MQAERIADSRANGVWAEDCFPLQTYLVQACPERHLTAAEAYSEWIKQGLAKGACKARLQTLTALPEHCSRSVPASWLQKRKEDLEEQLASTME